VRSSKTNDRLTLLLFSCDTVVVFIGLIISFVVRFYSRWFVSNKVDPPLFDSYLGLLIIGVVLFMALLYYLNLYHNDNLLRFREVIWIIVKASAMWCLLYLGVSLVFKLQPNISRLFAIISSISIVSALLLYRYLFLLILKRVYARNLKQRVLVVGWNQEATILLNECAADNSIYTITGCIDGPEPNGKSSIPETVVRLGQYEDLPNLLGNMEPDILILADVNINGTIIADIVNLCEKEYIKFKIIPSYFQILLSGLKFESFGKTALLGVTGLPLQSVANRICKRVVDCIGSVVGLLMAVPIIGVFGFFIYVESPGPIFYRQTRTGRNGREFQIIKLRSMKLNAESKGGAQWAVEDDPRRLKIGELLRKLNIDEVPQFWNVLKGEMSLVGPRPERPELIVDFREQIPHYNARHACKPGITGWAQINGWRGNTDLNERIKHDIWYIENWSVWLDIKIMLLTFVKRDNAY